MIPDFLISLLEEVLYDFLEHVDPSAAQQGWHQRGAPLHPQKVVAVSRLFWGSERFRGLEPNPSICLKFILYETNSHVVWHLAFWWSKTSPNPNDFQDTFVGKKQMFIFVKWQYTSDKFHYPNNKYKNIHDCTRLNLMSTISIYPVNYQQNSDKYIHHQAFHAVVL